MPYRHSFTHRFLRDLKKLPGEIQERIYKTIPLILENPHAGLPLSGGLEGCYRWRVGDYRIVYEIQERLVIVHFLDVGHRKSVYK